MMCKVGILVSMVCIWLVFQSSNGWETHTFEQVNDHFDLLNKHTFKQRYYIDTTHYRPGGPLFYTPGGENELTGLPYNLGIVLASVYGGVYAALEHRFYGESIPFGDRRTAFARHPGNIGKLTVEQAVADSAAFLMHLRETVVEESTPIFAFGGSYSGKLAAYLRYSHPHVCDAALASSAPVLLDGIDLGVSQFAYYEKVTQAAERTLSGCAAGVRAAFQTLLSMSLEGISDGIPLCSPLKNQQDLDELVQLVRVNFANAAMANYPISTETSMKKACRALLRAPGKIEAWKHFFEIEDGKCLDMEAFVASIPRRGGKVACGDFSGCGQGWAGEAWDYQSTTQVVQPIGSNNVTDMFPPLAFDIGWMKNHSDTYFGGAVVDVHGLAERFGLRKVHQLYTNVLWTNGALDPWSVGGVYNTTNSLILPNGAHHSELHEPSETDTADIIQARKAILRFVAETLDLEQGRGEDMIIAEM